MRRIALASVAGLVTAALLAGAAGGPGYWQAWLHGDRPPSASAAIDLAGGDAAPQPPDTPLAQGVEPAALQAAATTAQALGAQALLVARRGHRIYEWPANRVERRVRSHLLSRLVLAASDPGGPLVKWSGAAAGDGSLGNPWSKASRMRYGRTALPSGFDWAAWLPQASRDVWQPLQAATATYELDAARVPRLDRGLWLRARDALALFDALAAGGVLGGQHVLSAQTAAAVFAALADGKPPRGAEPFGAHEAVMLRDEEGTRAYFFPAQDLAILLVRADERRLDDETALAHQVLRGIVDRPAADGAPTLRDLVPSH